MTTTAVLRRVGQCSGMFARQLQQVSFERAVCPLVAQKRLAMTKADAGDNSTIGHVHNPEPIQHFRANQPTVTQKNEAIPVEGANAMPHRVWSGYELVDIQITHRQPQGFVDKAAYMSVIMMREGFDIVSWFKWGKRDDTRWIKRIVFLETVAAVPGMIAAMTRHFHLVRQIFPSYAQEAENERMHLMTALNMKKQSRMFRMGVLAVQGMFVPMFCAAYLISPRFCHRFVGYLEEEAVKSYTNCLEDIESGLLQHWQTLTAPDIAKRYWKLPENATVKEVIIVIRADEAHHRSVNHTFASMKETDYNPYKPGE